MGEQFKRSWRGWVKSSDGYSVRIRLVAIDYRDAAGEIQIDSETMSDPWNEVVVDTGSIPDTLDRPRAEVLGRLQKVFAFLGWRLTLE